MLLLNEDQFENSEQRFLLAKLVRYFSDPSVGISRFDCMNIEWKALNDQVMAGVKVKGKLASGCAGIYGFMEALQPDALG